MISPARSPAPSDSPAPAVRAEPAIFDSVVVKLTVLVGALLILTAGGLSTVGYTQVRSTLSSQIEERLQIVAGARRAALHRFVIQQETRVSLLGKSTRIRDLLNRQKAGGFEAEKLLEETNNLLKDTQEHTPGFLSISLTDKNGRIVRSTDPALAGRDLSDDADVHLGLTEAHLGLPRREKGRFIAWLAAPAENLPGKRGDIGALLVELDMTQAETLLDDREGLGETGRVYLGTRDGEQIRLLLNRETESIGLDDSPALAAALESDEGFLNTFDHRGRQVLAAYRPLGYESWGIVAQMDTIEAYRPLAKLRGALLTLVTGVMFAGLLTSYLLARRFARPIVHLAEASQAVGEGRWDTRVAIDSRDEVGQLGRSFNRMTEELAASYAMLEDRVQARTAALARSEQENRDQRQILESILKSMGDGVAVCDPNGKFLIFNPAGKTMLGRTKADPPITEWPQEYGVYLPDRVTPCPPQALPWARALRGEATDAIELYLRRNDATDGMWLSVTGRPMRDEQGELRGGVVVFRNMTQQKNAERALRQSQARYMSLVESLPLAVWSKDRDGVFTFANQLLAEMLGQPSEQIVGKTDFAFFPLEMAEQFVADDQIVIEQNRVIERVETITRADGDVIYIQSFKAPQFDEEGHVIGTQGLSWDISDMKRVEAELRHAREEADAANRAKSAFLANISHEIRTPMNGVLGITELVLDTPLSTEQRGFLSLVRESADVLLEVINDILDFSKIEAGRMELESNEFDLAEEIGDCMKALAVRAHKKGLEITYRIAPDVPTLLIGDAVRLRQVITNLAGNSIKFTLTGEVSVDITRDASASVDDDIMTALHITVRDTGIGIPADKLKTVFGAFEQADVSMTRKYGGTGLGLSISQRLIELMGGQVTVESVEGEGSTFRFTCHFGLQEPSHPPLPTEFNEVSEKRILVVDDHPTQRAVLKELLDGWGTCPTVVESVVAARQMLDQSRSGRPFDVVLIDAAMNGRSGMTLAQDVVRYGPGKPGVILLVTAECSMGDMHHCREFGVAHYLIKPVKGSELLTTIALALQPSAPVEPPSLADADAKLHAAKTLRVLLVEDSEVNQTVAVRLLERRGHEVSVVDNGAAAVELLTREHDFDVVLMDLQMPIMDGLTATAEIRRHEATSGAAHVPIIAMTAHAMKGDREKCLETGMDGYVSKPVRPKDLFDAVEGIGGSTGDDDEHVSADDTAPVVDWDAAIARLNGDRELLAEMIEVFRTEAPRLIDRISVAVRKRDAAELKISAHTLKGAVGNFAAKTVFAAALRLETLAKDGNFDEVPAAQLALEHELERLMPALDELVC